MNPTGRPLSNAGVCMAALMNADQTMSRIHGELPCCTRWQDSSNISCAQQPIVTAQTLEQHHSFIGCITRWTFKQTIFSAAHKEFNKDSANEYPRMLESVSFGSTEIALLREGYRYVYGGTDCFFKASFVITSLPLILPA